MKKQILWRSDLWSFTLAFGVISLFCLLYFLMHLVHHETGEAFATALVAFIPIVLTAFCAFTDRSGAYRDPPADPTVAKRLREEAYKDSFLNPDNIPPHKRNPPPGMIG